MVSMSLFFTVLFSDLVFIVVVAAVGTLIETPAGMNETTKMAFLAVVQLQAVTVRAFHYIWWVE